MALDILTLNKAKKYVNEIINGLGAIMGKNCKIKSITPVDGGNNVTFSWTADDGTEQTQIMFVKDGSYTAPIKLWENPDLTATFNSQTIVLDEQFSDCKYYEITCVRRSSSSTGRLVSFSTGRIPVSQAVFLQLFTQYYYSRISNVPNLEDRTIVIGDCNYASIYGGANDSVDNTFCVPWYIVGYKE